MKCKSRNCELYKNYSEWRDDKQKRTDDMLSMPDDCSRCKRAYPDMFIKKRTD